MPWLAATDCWASGHTNIEYRYVHPMTPLEVAIGEFLAVTNNEHDWSDMYRGCKVEEIDLPPREWLEDKLKSTEDRLKSLQAYRDMLKGILHG